MPTVNSYGARRVSTRPMPDTSRTDVRSPESFGSGVGRTLTGIGLELFAHVTRQERQRADELALLEADNRLSTWETNRLYDPNGGALSIQGKDSFGLPEEVASEMDMVGGEIAAGLSTERQRLAFARALASRKQAVNLTLHRHVFQEMQRFDVEQTTAFLQNATSAAIAASDPRVISEELARGVDQIERHALRTGAPAEVRDQNILAFRTRVHAGVIDRLLTADQDGAARAYFDEMKGQLDGQAIGRIEAALEEGTLRGQAQKHSDAILEGNPTQTQAIEAARKIEDPKLRDAVEDRVIRGLQIKKQAAAEQEEATLTDAVNRIEAARGDIAAVPASVWSTLSVSQRSALRSYGRAIAPGGPGEVETDLPTYYRLMQQAADNPQAFSSANLLQYIHKLGKTEFKELAGLQQRLRKGEGIEKELDDFRTENQVISDALGAFGIDAGDKDNDGAIARLRRMVAQGTSTLQRVTGKKASNADVQTITDDILSQEVSTPGSWWSFLPGGAPFFDQKRRLIDTTIADVPRADRAQIEAALRSQRKPVTDEAVLQLYLDTQIRLRRGAR